MKRRLPFVSVLAFGSTLALRVWGDADPAQYANFQYTDKRITDAYTHLVWDRDDSPKLQDPNIDLYCTSGTRLPTVKELLTLVDEAPTRVYDDTAGKEVLVHIDQNAFSLRSGYVSVDAPYCTQTRAPDSGNRILVDFATGNTVATNVPCRVRCVRFAP